MLKMRFARWASCRGSVDQGVGVSYSPLGREKSKEAQRRLCPYQYHRRHCKRSSGIVRRCTTAYYGADERQEWHFRGLMDRAQDPSGPISARPLSEIRGDAAKSESTLSLYQGKTVHGYLTYS